MAVDESQKLPGEPEDDDEEEVELNLRKIIKLTIIGVLILMGVLFTIAYIWREELKALGEGFVDAFGGPGVALGFFLPDGLTVPMPNDAFTWLGLEGGIPFWETVAWGTLGSVAGGTTGWLIGRLLQQTRFFKRVMRKRGAEVKGLVKKYGVTALAVAALTPIPYSLSCWAAGALGMTYRVFILVSVPCRFIRVALYLYLISLGIVDV